MYLSRSQPRTLDVGNLATRVLEALIGKVDGAPRSLRRQNGLIVNDHQVYRLLVEKRPMPMRGKVYGRLTIQSYA